MSVRKYEPIWMELKKKHQVRIQIPRPLHKRLIKAVIKEKYNDVVFKFELGERGKAAKLSYIQQGVVIVFQLKISLGLEDL